MTDTVDLFEVAMETINVGPPVPVTERLDDALAAVARAVKLPPSYEDAEDPSVRSDWAAGSEPWRIHLIGDADFALRRMGELQAEIQQLNDLKNAAISRIETRHRKLVGRAELGVVFFRAQLELWATEHRGMLLAGKKKSRQLLHGSIGWRSKPAKLEVTNDARLLDWAIANDMVRRTEKPAMDAIGAYFKKTGDIPPGTDVIDGHEAFEVKTTGGDNDQNDRF